MPRSINRRHAYSNRLQYLRDQADIRFGTDHYASAIARAGWHQWTLDNADLLFAVSNIYNNVGYQVYCLTILRPSW